MPYFHFPCDGERGGINLEDRAQQVRVGYRTDIRTDVCFAVSKSHIAAIRNIDLSDVPRLQIHDFQFMRTIDDRIEFTAIHLNIVANIAQFLQLVRVLRTVPIGIILSGLQVDIIESCFVGPHVPFAQHIYPTRSHLIRHMRTDGGIDNLFSSTREEVDR